MQGIVPISPQSLGTAITADQWNSLPDVEHEGDSGFAAWRSFRRGSLAIHRIRVTAGYLDARSGLEDMLLVIMKGALILDLHHGQTLVLRPGDRRLLRRGESKWLSSILGCDLLALDTFVIAQLA